MSNRATPSSKERATPSAGLRRAVDRWLADGRAQGWSARTLTDHRQNLERFAWWLENEEEAEASLSALGMVVAAALAWLHDQADRRCWVCGTRIPEEQRRGTQFCSAAHRQSYHERRQPREKR